jgi:hypothetical protein
MKFENVSGSCIVFLFSFVLSLPDELPQSRGVKRPERFGEECFHHYLEVYGLCAPAM